MRLRIKHLLLIVNGFIVVLALLGFVFVRLWDGHLVRITEQRLIAESVLVAEIVRDDLAALGLRTEVSRPVPVLELNYTIVERGEFARPEKRTRQARLPLETVVANQSSVLSGAHARGLSSTRILDANGCETDAVRAGICARGFPEVEQALAGNYAAVARRLETNLDRAGWNAGHAEVATALPLTDGDAVVAVVHMSRPSLSPFEVFWNLRWTLLACGALCLAFTFALTHFFSRMISRPVSALTTAAQCIARGEPTGLFAPDRFAPSEVHELASALDEMTARLNQRSEYIANFASHTSHELKTPLTGIRGAAELLQEDWDTMPAETRQRFLSNIDADAERMQRLTTRLLELARIESAVEEGAADSPLYVLEELCAAYGARVRADMSRAPTSIGLSPEHLETAVRNLIDNAIRHGGGQPIDVRVSDDRGRSIIEVRDHGAGISDKNRERVFDRFFTTERDSGGTGLGLAIVKAIVEMRGGSVTVETGGGGSVFTITV